jgi:hypothetical protein
MDERRIRITVEPRKEPDVDLYVRALTELARQKLEREKRDKVKKPRPTPGDAA